MEVCSLCNHPVSNEIMLTNGVYLHENCLVDAQDKLRNINNRSLGRLLIETLFGRPSNSKNKSTELANKLTAIYDYFPDYPPDWTERRLKILARDRDTCRGCKVKGGSLHIHHRIALGVGGSNLDSNLVALCPECHARRHGVKTFDDRKNDSNSSSIFETNCNLIQKAIDSKQFIVFQYRKGRESRYKERVVLPSEIYTFDKYETSSLCVKGRCQLRKADRSFAIRRVKNIKLVKHPPKNKAA